MFGHIFINRLKVLLRTKEMIFWSLIFPVALATFFHLAFSNLMSDDAFEPVDIAVVADKAYGNEKNFSEVLSEISKDNDDRVFNIIYVESEDIAKEDLENNKISGYYVVEDTIRTVVKKNGFEQTIMKFVVDNYYQTHSIISNISEFNPEAFKTNILEEMHTEEEYFEDISNTNVDYTVVYFYTLIGMVCINAGTFGINVAKESEANLSKRGARISISPSHKLKSLMISLFAALLIQYAEILILLAYLVFILGVNFGTQVPYILLLCFVGTIAGISAGTFVGVCNRKSDTMKVSIFTAVTMVFSFLSGMMIWQMRYIVENNVPILNRMNPVSMITDALYSLYYFSELNRYFYNIICLLIFSGIMIYLSYLFIRRKKYDSI